MQPDAEPPESRLLRFVEEAFQLAQRAVARYSSKSSINLTELPAPSTLCKAFDRLDMAVWRVPLDLSVSLLPTNGVAGIDASGFDRGHASKHYPKQTKLAIQQLKVTLLVDTSVNAILDFHITTTRRHETQIAPSRISRNTAEVDVLLGDKGYDDQQIERWPARTGFVR